MDQLKFIYQRLSILVKKTLSFEASENSKMCLYAWHRFQDEVKEYVTLFNYAFE